MTLVAQLARLQLEDAEDLDSFFIRGQELLTRLQEAGEAVSETLNNALVLNGLPMRYESFVILESFNLAANFTEFGKRLQNFLESKVQGHKEQSDLVALAVKRDFKRGPTRGNCFVCGIPLPRTAGGRRQHDVANVAKTPPRQGVQETKGWRQT